MSQPTRPTIESPDPPIYLHCGMHKTGTTYLQTLLAHNRDKLAAHGVFYPLDPNGIRNGHHGVARAFYRDDAAKRSKALDWLAQVAADPRPVLISSEGFSKVGAEGYAQIRHAVGSRVVIPVIFFREWSGSLPSRWQQNLNRTTQSLPSYLSQNLLRALDVDFINYSLILERLGSVFGRERLVAVAYDNALAEGHNLVDVMLGTIMRTGLGVADLDDEKARPNPSMQPEDAALRRLLGMMFANDAGLIEKLMNRRNKALLIEEVPELRTLTEYRETFTITADSHLFAQLNAALFADYGDRFVNPAEGRVFSEIGSRAAIAISLEEWLARHPAATARIVEVAAPVSAGIQPSKLKGRKPTAPAVVDTSSARTTKAQKATQEIVKNAHAEMRQDRLAARRQAREERQRKRGPGRLLARLSALIGSIAQLRVDREDGKGARKAARRAERKQRRAETPWSAPAKAEAPDGAPPRELETAD